LKLGLASGKHLESASGEIIACEVKAAETVWSDDFRGIQRLARRVGDQLLGGIVLYAGAGPAIRRAAPWLANIFFVDPRLRRLMVRLAGRPPSPGGQRATTRRVGTH
jgi:hypothetical protein